ncbi:Coiled-coil domain containing protein [Lasiodiplodia theobromae]|uniref:Coiled-coil domain containing protein n=1 Tax=Lasiodiplodia theobromae TaxID=45133 RepID=UPI0015C3EEB9|nr:Coiled-coil domain containing protein [Lasiodiplodia theobromae]KAF4542139.1 Coiled-coil domain containing protein [Lasiodiplodia theobromae]
MQPRLFHCAARAARTPALSLQLRIFRFYASPSCDTSAFARRNAWRAFGSTPNNLIQERPVMSSSSQPASELNNNITQEENEDFDQRVAEDKGKQIRTPWHREGSDVPPVGRLRSAGAMTKGKLLTTPSRMLKLILPLTTKDYNSDRKDVEPLALLVHPQQPLSYLERLIQSELPTVSREGKERIPEVYFRAEDSTQDSLDPAKKTKVHDPKKSDDDDHIDTPDELRIDGVTHKTGKLNRKSKAEANRLRGGAGEGGVESYSGLGHEAPTDTEAERRFVRWSKSTEIGDFIRDAARGQEFAIEIESAPHDIRVGVPSFNDRTYYLRMRLRSTSKKIADLADIKKECDQLAHKGAQRVALGGLGLVVAWWGTVYKLTFDTELGWDVMEPVTYLVGLSTLIGGYVWFLYHNREASYRSAMNITISRRQQKLYNERGFEMEKWQFFIEEANALRKEIKLIADEYDVEWDELADEKHQKVVEALRKERRKKENGGKKDDKDGDDGDD